MKKLSLPLAMAAATLPLEAHAHHAIYGRTPETWLEGFVSGLAHPVIEPLHFVAVIAVGILCGVRDRPLTGVTAFVAGTFLATWATGAAASGLMVELAVAVSVFVLGVSVWLQFPAHRSVLVFGLFLIGAVHGAAYAEAILGAGMEPLVAYLLGLTFVQAGFAILIAYSAIAFRDSRSWRPVAGAIISSAGAFAAVALLVASA